MGGAREVTGPTDGGDPAGGRVDPRIGTALVESSPDVFLVVDRDTTVRYVNDAITQRTGWPIDAIKGRPIVDLIHPEDLERALFDLEIYTTGGEQPGITTYRVEMADGSYERFDVSGAPFELDGEPLLALYGRPDESAAPSVLDGLLRHTSTADTLRPVCDAVNWRRHGSRVAISWRDETGFHAVSTDLPRSLVGADGDMDTPWGRCWRGGPGVRRLDLEQLDPIRRAAARELGLGAYWIEPVRDDDSRVCALVTVWLASGGPVPEVHALGMRVAQDYTELIMRWTRQRIQLQDAALRDPLTGLANRKAFFDALRDGDRNGAVLYCDLDGFKPVNDGLGHAAGDELLRAVAGRVKACVRAGDVVARLGGDEFAVLCLGMSEERALELAERIRAEVSKPFRVAGSITRVDISIGVAHTSGEIGEVVLDRADRALLRAKSSGGSVVERADD